jgi:hypothetical protein
VIGRRQLFDYIENDPQWGMVWGYLVARFAKASVKWWGRRKGYWKARIPRYVDQDLKIIARFRFRDQAARLLADLERGESQRYAYGLIRERLHRIEMADWLAGRTYEDRVGRRLVEEHVVKVVQCGDVRVMVVDRRERKDVGG